MTTSDPRGPGSDAWIQVQAGGSYFCTEDGLPWTPIGQNDAISWIELAGLFRRRDLAGVEAHLGWLRDHGVTCLRLMLEYAQGRRFYLERPAGHFVPHMVTLWDDLFRLCERTGLKILLTPFDTFWTWLEWEHHPYNERNGGPLRHPSQFLLSAPTRAAIRNRLAFAVERWGGSPALFAWDLWNEIHPAQADGSAECFGEFIHDLATHVRGLEMRTYGRSHPQTVSLFGPELWWRPEMDLGSPVFRHPDLDFATIHVYHEGTIDAPRNTVEPALSMGRIVRDALAEIRGRPPVPRQRARPDPHVQGQAPEPARGLRRRILPPHAMGPRRLRRGRRRDALAEPDAPRADGRHAPGAAGARGLRRERGLDALPPPQPERGGEDALVEAGSLRLRRRRAGHPVAPADRLHRPGRHPADGCRAALHLGPGPGPRARRLRPHGLGHGRRAGRLDARGVVDRLGPVGGDPADRDGRRHRDQAARAGARPDRAGA